MRLLIDNPITFHTNLLNELDDLLDDWQERLLTDKDPVWVESKIKNTKIAIAGHVKALEQLTNK